MKVPKINPMGNIPLTYIRHVNLDKDYRVVEDVLDESELDCETADKDDHLRFRFAHRLGLKVFEPDKPVKVGNWYFDFELKKVHKAVSAGQPDLNPLYLILAPVIWLLLSDSVTLDGRLVEAKSGRLLARKKLSNSITPKNYRSHHGPPTLPLIEHGALRLLNDLEKKALKTVGQTLS